MSGLKHDMRDQTGVGNVRARFWKPFHAVLLGWKQKPLKVSQQGCGMTQGFQMEDEFGSPQLCNHVQRGWVGEIIEN